MSNADDKLEALLDWKHRLDDELGELRAQRDELNEAIARKETQGRNLRELLESEGYVAEDAMDGKQPSNGSVADAAYELVKKVGQPLYYKDLADRLIDAGLSIPGRDPHANLLSYMVRDQRFQRTGRGTYALAEWGLRPRRPKGASGSRKRSGSRGG
ncbi:MAG: winged helix-turn-helix domain-containing protein [Chloroflexi bacterium]|nr:winged helix-turn-helix domain-containing protein [Chloroflexota bacterium]